MKVKGGIWWSQAKLECLENKRLFRKDMWAEFEMRIMPWFKAWLRREFPQDGAPQL